MDTRRRSWVKSLTWRIIGIFILGGITYIVTKDLGAVTTITLLFHGIRLILYYWHERLWEKLSWGKVLHPLAHFTMKEDLTSEEVEKIRVLIESSGYVAKRPEYEI